MSCSLAGQSMLAFLTWHLAGVVLGIDNGLGLIPPRGWRSWNAFDCLETRTILTQAHMMAQMDAVLDKSRLVNGKPTSLAELGFDWISMDDGWQRCNCSVRQDLDPSLPKCDGNLCFGGHCSWHDNQGQPMVRKDRFPDMNKLVDYGHSRQLKVGTYLNTCICNEHGQPTYADDVKWMMDIGFDGVKIDNCGSSTNVSHWAELMNATGKAIRIENCHNSWPDFKTGFCPMNFFRTGGDISADISSILTEAYATVDAADLPEPRSRPGCWAYPDMSEVGNFAAGPYRDDQERTHWGLWSIVSSPLILGFDMNDSETMDRVWPIITNLDALAVSESWIGHPGTLIRSYPSQQARAQVVQGPCDGSPATAGWTFSGGKLFAPRLNILPEVECLTKQVVPCPPPTTFAPNVQCGLALANCSSLPKGEWTRIKEEIQWHEDQVKTTCLYANPSDFDTSKGYFTRKAATVGLSACPKDLFEQPKESNFASPDSSSQCLSDLVNEHRKAALPSAVSSDNTDFILTAKGELKTPSGCLRAAPISGVQLWAKPINTSSSAVLLINPAENDEVLQWPVQDLPSHFPGATSTFACQPGHCVARDVWAQSSFPVTSATIPVHLKPWASAFYILTADHVNLSPISI